MLVRLPLLCEARMWRSLSQAAVAFILVLNSRHLVDEPSYLFFWQVGYDRTDTPRDVLTQRSNDLVMRGSFSFVRTHPRTRRRGPTAIACPSQPLKSDEANGFGWGTVARAYGITPRAREVAEAGIVPSCSGSRAAVRPVMSPS
jgi:hypothetical protein